ncbi:hypothetical protein JS756_18035 [Streptomyces actuosus]|uniref:Methyl-accepting chemotaxis protein n=1 Tax=Streptomyces actuosus TaxID=1885 RepID=A0ABS2VSC2_STRAS|nr:hypothetical protein [Streptomyces actuosus]MBN0045971.1 hypothetical protein [Streptomyces actuosus]
MPDGVLLDRRAVARSIAELAQRPPLEPRRQELTALAEALESHEPTALDPWSELDLLTAFARPESLRMPGARDAEPGIWSYLEAALGALVFAPLMLTWYGLTRASSAYEALTGTNPQAAERPFLQLWQSGFEGHLTGAFTFGHVALSATAAILVLFGLVLVHGLRRAAVTRREEAAGRDAGRLTADLVSSLTRAQLVLNRHRLSSPQRFAAELTQAAGTLTELGNKAVRVHRDLTAAAGVVDAAVQAAEHRLAGVDGAVRPLEDAAARIETAVSENGVRLGAALDDVRGAHGEVRAAVEVAGDRVEESVTVLAAAQRAYTTGIEVAADVVSQLVGSVGDITDRTGDAVRESQRAARELAAQTDALRDAAESFARLAQELRVVIPAATAPPAAGPRAARPVRETGEPGGPAGGPPDGADPAPHVPTSLTRTR